MRSHRLCVFTLLLAGTGCFVSGAESSSDAGSDGGPSLSFNADGGFGTYARDLPDGGASGQALSIAVTDVPYSCGGFGEDPQGETTLQLFVAAPTGRELVGTFSISEPAGATASGPRASAELIVERGHLGRYQAYAGSIEIDQVTPAVRGHVSASFRKEVFDDQDGGFAGTLDMDFSGPLCP